MSFLDQKNSRKQGDVGVAIAIAWFTSRGFYVSIPLSDSQHYDLVVDDGRLNRVQVKTSRHKTISGTYEFQLDTRGGNRSWSGVARKFDPRAVDYLFLMTSDGDMYIVPTDEFTNHRSITTGTKYERYRVTWGDIP